jgi:hypothetical protein
MMNAAAIMAAIPTPKGNNVASNITIQNTFSNKKLIMMNYRLSKEQ